MIKVIFQKVTNYVLIINF